MKTLITTHINADFDAFAGVIGAKKLYPEGIIVFPGSIEKRVRDFIETFKLSDTYQLGSRLKDIDLERIESIIIVDASSPERIGEIKRFLNKARVLLFDHHKGNDLKTEIEGRQGNEVIIEEVGAVSTLFTEILQKKNILITPLEATILCLGIYEETGSLTYPSTTERDLLAVAYLLKRGANLNIVSAYLKPFINKEDLQLLNEFLENSKEVLLNNLRIKICKAKIEEYPGEVAPLAHRIMEMEEIDALILLLEISGRIVIIARSGVPEVDVAQIMSRFGGGGHPTAASAILKDKDIDEVEDELLNILKEGIRVKLAKDIMTRHVLTIKPDATVKEAERELTKYGVNVLPVVKNGKLLGLISREIVEKALFHGFKLHKVIEFATLEPEFVAPETPVSEVEKIMIEQNQRFIPVIENGKLVGAITRTDILRTLYEDLMRKARPESDLTPIIKEGNLTVLTQPRIKNLTSLLQVHFPPETLEILKLAGEVADSLGYNAYLVGGSVRDLLRGEKNLDIDIVIEGDGILFAKELAEKITQKFFGAESNSSSKVTLKTHEKFRTAKLIIGGARNSSGLIVDIATARTEYYEAPASLPKVESSSIKKDLYRRDFTINTLAIKLNSADFGILIDFFGGQKDLKERTIRVLHSLSFVEDPTRALRAIRFSERFGFKISKHTEALMKRAIKSNLFERLSKERLYEELSLLFNEVSPLRAVVRLEEYRLLSILHPSLRLNDQLKKSLKSLEDVLAWFSLTVTSATNTGIKGEIKRDRLVFGVLFSELPPKARVEAIERISPNKRYRKDLEKDIREAERIVHALTVTFATNEKGLTDPVKIYELLHENSIESHLLAMAIKDVPEVRKPILKYLTELKDIKPLITGKDLLKMGFHPGPEFSEIFRKILYEKLRGKLQTKEEEIEFVKSIFY